MSTRRARPLRRGARIALTLGAATLVLLIGSAAVGLGVPALATLGAFVVLWTAAFAILAYLDRAARADRRTATAYLLKAGVVLVIPVPYAVALLTTSEQADAPHVQSLQLLLGSAMFLVAWTRLGTQAWSAAGPGVVFLDAVVAFFASVALMVLRAAPGGELTTLPAATRATILAQGLGFAVLVWVLGRSRERGPLPWKQLVLWIASASLFLLAVVEASTGDDPMRRLLVPPVALGVALVMGGLAALRPEHEVETPDDVRVRERVSRWSSAVAPTVLFVVLLGLIWRDEDVPREVALLAMAALAGVLLALVVLRRSAVHRSTQREVALGREALEPSDSHPWLETLVSQADDVITVIDQHGRVLYQAPSAARVLGYAPGTWVGRDFHDLVPPSHTEVLDAAIASAARVPTRRTKASVPIVTADGRHPSADITVTAISSGGRVLSGFVLSTRLVPDSHVPRSELDRANATDSLTGRANLVGFRRQAEQAVIVHGQGRVGILVLDLDGFTELNDRMGHDVGDELLRAVGDAIARCVRPWDLVARVGGDEFAVLVVGSNVERAIVRIHDRVRRALVTSAPAAAAAQPLTARAGYAVNSASDVSAADLLRNADLALSRARSSPHIQLQPYRSSMHEDLVARAEKDAELRSAFARGEFELLYQPVVTLPSQAIVGVEALIRWNHPVRGLLAPGEFLRLVGELGLGSQLCTWVVQESARAAAVLSAVDPSDTRMAVGFNVDADDLHAGLVRDLDDAVARYGIGATRLVVEVTEESLVSTGSARETIAELRARGVKVAIDDFGVGFSSLSYLATIPVDYVKVDRSFIDGVTHGSTRAALVGAVIGLAEALSLDAVVEGLETAGEVEVVYELGARFAQGWFFARALPLEEVVAALHEQVRSRREVPGSAGGAETAPAVVAPTRLQDSG